MLSFVTCPAYITKPLLLQECNIAPSDETQLGTFLRSLPHLEALIIAIDKDYNSERSYDALLSCLASPVTENTSSLKELHITYTLRASWQ